MDEGARHGQTEYAINQKIINRIGANRSLDKMEGPVREYRVEYGSPDIKRIFLRFFNYMSLQVHIVQVVGRSRLPDDLIERVEEQILGKLAEANAHLDDRLRGAEVLLAQNGITTPVNYLAPLNVTVKVTSKIMRRYMELLTKANGFFRLIDTLAIEELVPEKRGLQEKAEVKKRLRHIPSECRRWAVDVRRKIDQLSAEEAKENRNGRRPTTAHESVEMEDTATGEEAAALDAADIGAAPDPAPQPSRTDADGLPPSRRKRAKTSEMVPHAA